MQVFKLPWEKLSTIHGDFDPLTCRTRIPSELDRQVSLVCRRQGSGVRYFYLSAWLALLGRLSGQNDLILGVAVNPGPTKPRCSPYEGRVTCLPLTVSLKDHLPFTALLSDVKARLESLETGLASSHGSVSAFPAAFEMRDHDDPDQEGLRRVGPDCPQVNGDRFKIKLNLRRSSDAVHAIFEYDSHVLAAESVQRMAGLYQNLLNHLVSHSEDDLDQLEILDEADRRQALVDFNQTHWDHRRVPSIAQLFEEQAIRHPDRIAVQCGNSSLSYGNLNARANQWAWHLRSQGVGPETLVGVFLPRSVEMMVAILGIVKAGGAWLPMDPAYPKDRLAFMFQDAQLHFLITCSDLLKELPEPPARTFLTDVDSEAVSKQSTASVQALSSPQSLAYLIYTSGSTGHPKGVMITQDCLVHYVQALKPVLRLGPDTVYLHTATFAFSSSVRQMMAPLTAGARVVIATREEIRDPEVLWELILREGVTTIDIVPSYWRHCQQILNALEPGRRARLLDNQLQFILTASEPLHNDLPRQWALDLHHPAQIVNMYGQTETTGIVSTFPVEVVPNAELRIVPIGQPLANTRMYILDAHRRPVPLGVAGEIFIGGLGVGRGYWRQPEITAERFVPDPFSSRPGDRLYRTGDLGRYRPDGVIEFVGRMDHQVKIRGFRVELGEIECALNRHPGVRQAILTAYQDPALGVQLAAYVVAQPGLEPVISELRQFLGKQLPDYMVPSAFVFLDKFPLGPSGKINRRALPPPDRAPSSPSIPGGAPRTELESLLCSLWSHLLRRETVGVNENFFELGGQSLLAAQMLSRARETLQVEIPWSQLFESPTVAGLARFLEGQRLQAGPEIPVVASSSTRREEGEI